MDFESRLSISYYREVAVINQAHHIFLVQHLETHKFYVKKILDVYNKDIYCQLKEHPITGIPRILELFEENKQLTIIEEYVSGETLDEYLNTHGPLNEAEAAKYVLALCSILSELHHLTPAIIHRDIKPSNVMLTPHGNIVLLDLNAAKYVDSSKNTDTLLLGTQGYAAPEQYGFGSSNIQTDIYGLGVLFNTLLTCDLPSNRLARGRFTNVIKKSTQLRPDDRYPSIDAFQKAILNLLPEKSAENPHKNLYQGSFLPPGYRTKNFFHMLIATLGYAMIFWIGCTIEIENATASQLMIERIFYTLLLLCIVFFSCNYRNVHNVFPFCSHSSKPIRIFAIIFFDFIIFLTMLVLLVIVETVFL